MADRLLVEYVRAVLTELHLDPKMKGVLAARMGHRKMQDMSRAKGLALRWSLEREIELTPEIESFAQAAYVKYVTRYGRAIAPHALVQLLDRRYNGEHVGSKPDVPVGDSGGKTRRPERADDPEAARAVLSDRTL